ncbi:MAG: winged helix-turn-helix transcriptional regulator [Candidatus Thermoplasmatota archaeon]|nr:winged helix-turn-helix transcriptional regulator [Candidatus Thermoplasmatota archaeon]
MGKKTLELEARKKTYEAIDENPGVHLRELDRKLDIPLGTLRYHLRVLEKKDMIVSKKESKYKRYYARGEVQKEDKELLSTLRKELPRTIILFLLEYPGSTHKEICSALAVSGSTLSYHLKKLREREVIEKEEKEYSVKDEEKVAEVLIRYQQTFLDRLVDRFVRFWKKEEGED